MKIVLVAPYTAMSAVYNNYLASLGVLSLGTVLRENHYDVEIVDYNHLLMTHSLVCNDNYNDNLQGVVDCIVAKQPDVVGFHTLCASLQDVLWMARTTKTNMPDVKIVMGGPQSVHLPQRILEAFPWIDVVCVGEGERIIIDLVRGLETGNLQGVAGIVYRNRDQVIRNQDAELIPDLDSLPLIDYGLIPYLPSTRITMEIGRGCPYQCTYCSTSRYWRRKNRVKSLTRIHREIEGIRQYVPAGDQIAISFVDDNFTTNRKFTLELCKMLQDMNIAWDCSARLDTLDEEVIKQMAQAGCMAVFMGIETGSPRLQQAIHKNLNLDRFEQIVDMIMNCNMEPVISLMYGFPSETEQELRQTLKMIIGVLRKGGTRCGLHSLCIIGGTQMYEDNKGQLVLRDQCSNIVDNVGLDRRYDLFEGNKDLFPHIYTLEGSLAEQFLYLEKFVNLIVMSLFPVYPRSILSVLDIYNDDILDFYKDFIHTTVDFPILLQQHAYTKLALDKAKLFKYLLKCFFSYLAAKSVTDFRFELVKHQLWKEQEKILPELQA